MERRSFLKGILLAGMAPAIVKAGSLMRINPEIVIAQPQDVFRVIKQYTINDDPQPIGSRLLTINQISDAALRILEKELNFMTQYNKDYDQAFAGENVIAGTMVKVRRPMRMIGEVNKIELWT